MSIKWQAHESGVGLNRFKSVSTGIRSKFFIHDPLRTLSEEALNAGNGIRKIPLHEGCLVQWKILPITHAIIRACLSINRSSDARQRCSIGENEKKFVESQTCNDSRCCLLAVSSCVSLKYLREEALTPASSQQKPFGEFHYGERELLPSLLYFLQQPCDINNNNGLAPKEQHDRFHQYHGRQQFQWLVVISTGIAKSINRYLDNSNNNDYHEQPKHQQQQHHQSSKR